MNCVTVFMSLTALFYIVIDEEQTILHWQEHWKMSSVMVKEMLSNWSFI